MLLFFCLIIACKKEQVNNPDIDEVTLNISAESTDPSLFNYLTVTAENELTNAFQFFIFHPDGEKNQHTIELRIQNSNIEFLIETTGSLVINKVERNTEIKPSSNSWHINNGRFLLMYYHTLDGTTNGFSDIGDQYIAFRKKNATGGYNYGWMLVNIERGEKITLKEYALHKIADTPIKAGEK